MIIIIFNLGGWSGEERGGGGGGGNHCMSSVGVENNDHRFNSF